MRELSKSVQIPWIGGSSGLHSSMQIHPAVHFRSLDFIVVIHTSTNTLTDNSVFTESWKSYPLQLLKLMISKEKSRGHLQNVQGVNIVFHSSFRKHVSKKCEDCWIGFPDLKSYSHLLYPAGTVLCNSSLTKTSIAVPPPPLTWASPAVSSSLSTFILGLHFPVMQHGSWWKFTFLTLHSGLWSHKFSGRKG